MLNLKETKAKIYKAENKGKYTQATIMTSKKDKQSDQWVTSFWTARFVGEAHNVQWSEKVRFTITDAIAEMNEWTDKEGKKRSTPQLIIFKVSDVIYPEQKEVLPFEPDTDEELPF